LGKRSGRERKSGKSRSHYLLWGTDREGTGKVNGREKLGRCWNQMENLQVKKELKRRLGR